MTSRSSSEELRTRALEAIAELLDEGGLTHRQIGPRSELVAKDWLAAAEPFIRELVVAQVVEWLATLDEERSRWRAGCRLLGSEIERQFGGSR